MLAQSISRVATPNRYMFSHRKDQIAYRDVDRDARVKDTFLRKITVSTRLSGQDPWQRLNVRLSPACELDDGSRQKRFDGMAPFQKIIGEITGG